MSSSERYVIKPPSQSPEQENKSRAESEPVSDCSMFLLKLPLQPPRESSGPPLRATRWPHPGKRDCYKKNQRTHGSCRTWLCAQEDLHRGYMSPSSLRRTATICTRNRKAENEKTTAHASPNAAGHLYEARNEPIPDLHRVTFPLFTEPAPHLFILRYRPRVTNSCGVNPPRNPRALCSEHRPSTVRSNCTFNDPASVSQSNERQPCRETQRTEICGVSDEAVRARGY